MAQDLRADAARQALAPNTARCYGYHWRAWRIWSLGQCPSLPAAPEDVARYLLERFDEGWSPSSCRAARAAIRHEHQIHGIPNPGADEVVRHTLHRIARDGRSRGRGQVAPVSWTLADQMAFAATMAADPAGLRDAALIRTMSDGLLRVSEAAAVQVAELVTRRPGRGPDRPGLEIRPRRPGTRPLSRRPDLPGPPGVA